VKEAYLYNAYYELLISRRSCTARVNEEHTCHPHVYPQVEWPYLLLTPSSRASPHFGWY